LTEWRIYQLYPEWRQRLSDPTIFQEIAMEDVPRVALRQKPFDSIFVEGL
jgi:hypothetical protein